MTLGPALPVGTAGMAVPTEVTGPCQPHCVQAAGGPDWSMARIWMLLEENLGNTT